MKLFIFDLISLKFIGFFNLSYNRHQRMWAFSAVRAQLGILALAVVGFLVSGHPAGAAPPLLLGFLVDRLVKIFRAVPLKQHRELLATGKPSSWQPKTTFPAGVLRRHLGLVLALPLLRAIFPVLAPNQAAQTNQGDQGAAGQALSGNSTHAAPPIDLKDKASDSLKPAEPKSEVGTDAGTLSAEEMAEVERNLAHNERMAEESGLDMLLASADAARDAKQKEKAQELYEQACELGSQRACWRVAFMSARQKGPDHPDTLVAYRVACDLGEQKACDALKRLVPPAQIDDGWVIALGAAADEQAATTIAKDLYAKGITETEVLWMGDYTSLGKKDFWFVCTKPIPRSQEDLARTRLEGVKRTIPDAYGLLLSKTEKRTILK